MLTTYSGLSDMDALSSLLRHVISSDLPSLLRIVVPEDLPSPEVPTGVAFPSTSHLNSDQKSEESRPLHSIHAAAREGPGTDLMEPSTLL